MNEQIKEAVDVSQRAQRNYDLSKTISDHDLETLVYAAVNSPSKQNETHFSLKVYTDPSIIRLVYSCTKKFAVYDRSEQEFKKIFKEENNQFWFDEDRCVHNSQILANAIFIYLDDVGTARNGEHMLAKKNVGGVCDITYQEQKNFSLGISAGQLILSAALLGYKTGLCSAFSISKIQNIINTKERIKLIVGIGYENVGVDRLYHAETLNKDMREEFRNGKLDEPWKFPTLNKTIKVSINDR